MNNNNDIIFGIEEYILNKEEQKEKVLQENIKKFSLLDTIVFFRVKNFDNSKCKTSFYSEALHLWSCHSSDLWRIAFDYNLWEVFLMDELDSTKLFSAVYKQVDKFVLWLAFDKPELIPFNESHICLYCEDGEYDDYYDTYISTKYLVNNYQQIYFW